MIFLFLFYISLIFILNLVFLKLDFLKSNTGFRHQLFANKSVPLSGGLFLLFPFTIILYESFSLSILTFLLLLLLGFLSDINIFSKAKFRFILQLIIISFFVLITQLEVLPTRIDYLDSYLQGTYTSYFFSVFCLMILINGSNFIDGLNGLLVGYIILIFFILLKTNLFQFLNLENQSLYFLFGILIYLIAMNFFNLLFMGDSGAYSLSFLIGFFLIKIYNFYPSISPYFIILLLWYPCFENLFSIVRKLKISKNPLYPDSEHLHHYLYSFVKKKFKLSDLTNNNLTSIIINIFHLIILMIASLNIYSTKLQIFLILISTLVYIATYYFLKKKINKTSLFKH